LIYSNLTRKEPSGTKQGFYLFNAGDIIQEFKIESGIPSAHKFGTNNSVRDDEIRMAFAHGYMDNNSEGAQYWRDFGRTDIYREADLDLLAAGPRFDLTCSAEDRGQFQVCQDGGAVIPVGAEFR